VSLGRDPLTGMVQTAEIVGDRHVLGRGNGPRGWHSGQRAVGGTSRPGSRIMAVVHVMKWMLFGLSEDLHVVSRVVTSGCWGFACGWQDAQES
jgi:hypothetical protein